MSRSHNVLEIPMGDYEEPIVLNNGEEAKAFVESIINATTYSRRWRGRGKRKQHAIAQGYSARGYDQDLPLEFSERQVLYVTAKPTKIDKRLQRERILDHRIDILKSNIDETSSRRIELGEELERAEDYKRNLIEKLHEAIRERTKLTKPIKEV
jgi:hypothetical protein